MRLVVLGWGNDSRGDDALGPALLDRIAAAWPDLPMVDDYQLQIEHALDLVDADCALFLDAGKDTPAPFAFSRLAPKRDATHSTHALSPEAVLDVYVQVRGEAPPPAFALCVRGESFELGEGLSPDGRRASRTRVGFRQDADGRTIGRGVGRDWRANRRRWCACRRRDSFTLARVAFGRRHSQPSLRARRSNPD